MRLTLGRKLAGAFGIVVLIMLVIVFVSLRAGAVASRGIGDVARRMTDSESAGTTFQQTLLMRLAATEFLQTNEQDALRRYEAAHQKAVEHIDVCEKSFTSKERLALIAQARSAVAGYHQAFQEIAEVISERNEIIATRLDVIGPRLVEKVQQYQQDRLAADDLEHLRLVAPLAARVLEVRIATVKYLRQTTEQNLASVLEQVRLAENDLKALRASESDPATLAVIDGIAADTAAYTQAFERIGELVERSDQLVNTDIAATGQRISDARVALFESLLADSQHSREQVTASLSSSRSQTIAAAFVAVAIAVALALVVTRGITRPVRGFLDRFALISKGDFTQRVECRTKDEIGDLAAGFNALIAEIAGIISGVQSTAEQVAAAATEVAASSEEMAASSEHQRAQLTQVAAAIEEMAATVTEVSGRTGEVSRQSTDAGDKAAEGGDIVRRTVDEMNQIASQVESTSVAVGQLSERAVQIGEILTVINDIADQTNLLALNAAIEAARAGEHGRGFAVVADEVRKLAERTQQATQEVSQSIGEIQSSTGQATDLMTASQQRVAGGVDLANQAGQSLDSIVRGSGEVARSIDSIAAAVEQQSASSAEIARAIESISASADEATQGAGQAAAAATQLSGNAESLREMVIRFKV